LFPEGVFSFLLLLFPAQLAFVEHGISGFLKIKNFGKDFVILLPHV
jgi:hypothetical protein